MSFIKNIWTVILALSVALPLSAQNVLTGTARDQSGKAIGNVVVKALNKHKKLVRYTLTNRQGTFRLVTADNDSITSVSLSCLGYASKTFLRKDFAKLKNVTLQEDAVNIKEVVVKSVPIRQRGDTLTYSVNAFKKGSDRTIEDVIKRLPGINVDNSGGIYYQGERISKFYIENMDMLSGNYTLATQNINPDDVAAVNIYENHQPVRAMKGLAFSDKAALNLKIKENRKLKPIGYLQQTLGYDDQTLWKTDIFGMAVNKKSQQLLSLKANNTGQTFNTAQNLGEDRISDFSSFIWDGISLSAQDIPNVALQRYVDNRSGEGAFNSLFKLKEKQILTLNLRYAGDAIHYDNQKYSSIFAGDNLYQDFAEKTHAAVFSNKLTGKIKLENNTEKIYFLDNLSFTANFYHKRFELEDNFDGIQRQKSNNCQLVNQFNTIYHVGKYVFELQSNIKFSNTPVNRLEALPHNNGQQMYQTLNETVFQTDEHTSFAWQMGRVCSMGVRVNFESYYNNISLYRMRTAETDVNDTYKGYMLHTSMEPYFQCKWNRIVWKVNVPLSLLNIHFENKAQMDDYRLDKTYANVNTSIDWNILKGLKLHIAGGTRCNFGDIANYVTSPIYYTYKDVTTKGTGYLTNKNSLFANGRLNFHNTMEGLFASIMGSISRSNTNAMQQTSIADGSVYSNVTDRKNTFVDRMLTLNASKSIYSTGTSVQIMATIGNSKTNIMSRNLVLSLENDRSMFNSRIDQELWNEKLNLSADYTYSQTQNRIDNMNTKMTEHALSFSISCLILKDLELFGDITANWLREEEYKEQEKYANAGLRYKKSRVEVELLAQNLTNQRYYVVNKQVRESNYRYVYHLRPIGLSLSMKYSF